jgi:hypothetical protein
MSRIAISLCAFVFCSLVTFGQSSAAINILGQPATTVSVGTGCSPFDVDPIMVSTAPRIGQTVSLTVFGSPAGAPGYLFMGKHLAVPSVLQSGCPVYLDLDTSAMMGPFQLDGTGMWHFTAPVAVPLSYVGQSLCLQAALVNEDDVAADLMTTNAILWTFGF